MTEAALASADAPHAPQVILQLLAKLGIACREVSDSAELPAARRVQAVLLDDAVGTLLVLFPQSQLLDLARLTELTGRKLLAIKPERLERMLGKHELHRLPALPPLTSSPCLYDERLLQEPRRPARHPPGDRQQRLPRPAGQGQRRALRRTAGKHQPEP